MTKLPAPPPARTVRDLVIATGLSAKVVRREIRAGLLPGEIHGDRYVVPAGEFDRWVNGLWTPNRRPTPLKPVEMMNKRKVA